MIHEVTLAPPHEGTIYIVADEDDTPPFAPEDFEVYLTREAAELSLAEGVPDGFPWKDWRHFHTEVIVPIMMCEGTEEATSAMAKLKDTDPYFVAAAFFFAARAMPEGE